jgi:hypothetical protein
MRIAVAIVLLTATAALAQTAAPALPASSSMCGECGVVRSVRSIRKEIRPTEEQEDMKLSGLVASVPLKGGKATIGSSNKLGAPTVSQTWEVVVRQDDGKIRIVTLDARPDLKQGDKVRMENGKPIRR